MDHFLVKPGGWTIAKRSWASLRGAFGAMPWLFLSAMLLGALLSIATFHAAIANLALTKPKSLSADMMWPALAARTALSLVWALLAAPVAVAMHRFILLGQATRGLVSWLPRYTLAFTGWLFALRLVFSLINMPIFLLRETGAEIFVLFCMVAAVIVVGVYCTMLFPAVATQVPAKSISARLETSMALMSGHFWLFVWSVFLAILPIVALSVAVQAILLKSALLAASAGTMHGMPRPGVLVGAALSGAIQIASIALMAAVASWFYGWVSRASSSGAASG